MEFVQIIFPGLSFFCFTALLLLAFIQFRLYQTKGFRRSKAIGLFCLFSGFYTFNEVVVYAGHFSADTVRFFVVGFQFLLYVALYFYMKSLGYFISIPLWLQRFYQSSMLCLGLVHVVFGASLIAFDIELVFDRNTINETGHFFVDAYTTRLGEPTVLAMSVYSAFSLIHGLTSGYILFRIYQSSKDFYLMAGLTANLVACGMEFLVLPISLDYYIPLVFLANIFEAFRMNSIASREAYLEKLEQEEVIEEEDVENKGLNQEQLSKIAAKIEKLMEKEKLYLNSNLKVSDLARSARTPSYLVSQAISFHLNTNYFQWISQYRIEEAKRRLLRDPDKNIMEVAYESGFNSKSSFNTSFKKIVGQTPSEYRKDQNP